MDDLKKALTILSEGNNRLTGAEQLIYSQPIEKETKSESWIKPYMMLVESEMAERSVSQAQAHTMAGAAHNPEFAKKVGIKQSVAREFNRADKGKNIKSLPVRKSPVDEGDETPVGNGFVKIEVDFFGRKVVGLKDTQTGSVIVRNFDPATGGAIIRTPARYIVDGKPTMQIGPETQAAMDQAFGK